MTPPGNLRRTPNFGEAADFRKEDYGLHRISIAVWRGMLFVNLDPDAGPLEAGLGDLVRETSAYPIEDYRFVHQEVFDMNCNWKTYTDNFVEGYHVPGIHPPFAAVIDFERFTTEGRNRTVIMQAPQKDGSFYGGLWLWRYPNTTLSVFPGGMNMSRIIPLGARRTRLVYNFFFADDFAGRGREEPRHHRAQLPGGARGLRHLRNVPGQPGIGHLRSRPAQPAA